VESDSDLKKLLEAYGNTTQLKVAQGGTLGMPRQGITNGVQANVDAHFGGDSVSPDVLASYGGLELSDNLNADVFAEIVDQDVPRLVLGGTTIDHKPTTQKLSTGGVRIQWTFGISNWCAKGADVENVSTKDSHSAIIKALKGRGTKQGNCDKLIGLTTHSVSAGLRIIRRSGLSADSPSATGGSFEVLYQYDKNTTKHGLGLFVGVSGMAMNPTSETLGSTTTQFPKFSLLRPTAGVEFRGAPTDLAEGGSPRIGAYGVLSRGTWSDPYTMGGTRSDQVYSSEIEGGVYLGGKFTSGFSGMIAFRVLRAFGRNNDLQYIVSIIPSAVSVSDGSSSEAEPKDGVAAAPPSPPAAAAKKEANQ
jgi:hypothetical protein